jgi:thioredoxin 1
LFLIGCSSQHASGPSDAIELTDDSFQATVLDASQPVLVDFWGPWCGPCRTMGPIVDELATQYKGSIKVCKVNVDDCPLVSKEYEIESIPLLLVFESGEIKKRFLGVQPKSRLQAALEVLRK